ncbi:MAG: cytochrome b/b6 domain-containing protein [Alphaproteobacteria bacterium]
MAGPRQVRVWDPLVRLFHWSLVGAFFTSFLIVDSARIHERAGYVVLGLLAFRVIWGMVGSRHARFSDFVKPPMRVLGYLLDILRGHAARYLGHNPAGGAMILALIAGAALTAGSGWLSTTDALWGVAWVEELHEAAAYGTVALVGLHVLGVIAASLSHRENLVLAMVTGKKRA